MLKKAAIKILHYFKDLFSAVLFVVIFFAIVIALYLASFAIVPSCDSLPAAGPGSNTFCLS